MPFSRETCVSHGLYRDIKERWFSLKKQNKRKNTRTTGRLGEKEVVGKRKKRVTNKGLRKTDTEKEGGRESGKKQLSQEKKKKKSLNAVFVNTPSKRIRNNESQKGCKNWFKPSCRNKTRKH